MRLFRPLLPRSYLVIAAALCVVLPSCASLDRHDETAGSASEPLPLKEDELAASEPLLEAEPQPELAHPTPAQVLIERALGALGTRYRFGGTRIETGFDCSGFVRWIYEEIAASLPRSAQALSEVEAPIIEREALEPGDLVFFRINRSRNISHVGMYMGEGQFIHAPSRGGRVRVESIDAPYWRARLVKARRWTELLARATAGAKE